MVKTCDSTFVSLNDVSLGKKNHTNVAYLGGQTPNKCMCYQYLENVNL